MNDSKKRIGFLLLGFALGIGIIFFAFSNNTKENNDCINPAPSVIVSDLYIPDSCSIFNEKVPLEYFEVTESLERELLVNVYYQSQTVQFIKYVHRYFPIMDSIFAKYNVPSDFKYVALAESGLKVNISPKGAAGFWQFLESTARENDLIVNDYIDQRYDLIKSTEAACKFLLQSYQKFGSWTMVAASYNLGMGGLKKQSEFQKITSYYDLYTNSETARYVFRIIALKLIIENPEKYGYQNLKPYPAIPYSTITVDSTISNLVDFAASQGSNYKMIKMMNPWLREKSLPNESHTPYKIIIIKNSDRKIK